MDLHRTANGKWELRWREGGRKRSRTFDRKRDAQDFHAWRRRRRQLGQAAVLEDVPLRELVETYWRLHAVPSLAPSTRDFYARAWTNHIMPRVGDYGVRELTPTRLTRFDELERANVGAATVRKTLTVLQSILSFAVAEELVEVNAARRFASRATSGRGSPTSSFRQRSRRSAASSACATGRSVLAYSWPTARGGRLPSHVGRRRRTGDPLRRHQAPPGSLHAASDLREWFLASGRPAGKRPVFPAHDGEFWGQDDWRNWRRSRLAGRAGASPTRSEEPEAEAPTDVRRRARDHETYARAT